MRYFVCSDIHGYYSFFQKALKDAGFFSYPGDKKIILLGDLFDRGTEACLMQDCIVELMSKKQVLLVKGNHEDLFMDFVDKDNTCPLSHHLSNGTYGTALQLTGFKKEYALQFPDDFADAIRKTSYYTTIIPAMNDYLEIGEYIFVHGWIPCLEGPFESFASIPDWRNSTKREWEKARWICGLKAFNDVFEDKKTIVCGHWHTSYGHAILEGKGSEFGLDADFSPFFGNGIIAIDACTAFSKMVNCLVIDVED